MFLITQKDKREILKILLEHKCKCRMSILVENFSYSNDKKTKKAKIREVIKVLNRELSKTIKLQILENKGFVEIIY